jgi:hypothetical protein
MTIQEVKQVEQQLRDSIFRSQGEYSLGALGFRIDLETFTNTRGLEVPQPQYGQEQAPREKTEIVQASPKDELVSLFNSGAREISYEEASRITGKRQCSFKISVARGGLKKTEAGNIELQSLIDRYEILMKIKTNPKRAPKPREARVQSPEDEALAKAAYMRLEELTPNGKLDLAQIAYVAGSRDRSNGTRIAQSEEMRSYRIPEGRRIYIKPEGLRAYLDRRIVIHGEWHLKK